MIFKLVSCKSATCELDKRAPSCAFFRLADSTNFPVSQLTDRSCGDTLVEAVMREAL